MESLVWCHCSDAHLGYKQYNLPERLHDFGKAFNECISLIIKQKPAFIIFTGDLFEHYNPNPPELRQAIKILSILKNSGENGQGIPIYVISGNHDVSYSASKRYGGDILDFFQDLGLIHYLKDTYEIIEKDGKPIALIAGLRYYGKNTTKKLKEFYEKYEKEFNRTDIPKILMLHTFVEGMVANFDISSYGLNTYPFDYIAVGHYHIRWPVDFTDKKNKIFSTGGTEHRTAAEWEHPRGFITVKAENHNKMWELNPEFRSYEVREKKVVPHDFKITTTNEVIRGATDLIQQYDKQGMLLRLILQGTLKKGEYTFLNLQKLKQQAKNLLYIDITNYISISPVIGPTSPKTDREAYIDVFKNNFNIKKEYLDSYVALIEAIVNIAYHRDFNELTTNILDDFVAKTPEAIIDRESTEEKIKAEEKPKAARKAKSEEKLKAEEQPESDEKPKSPTIGSKKVKKPKGIKKLTSFK